MAAIPLIDDDGTAFASGPRDLSVASEAQHGGAGRTAFLVIHLTGET